MLLKKGHVLTGPIIEKLKAGGVPAVFVDLGFGPVESQTEAVSEQLRRETVKQVKDFFEDARRTGRFTKAEQARATVEQIAGELLAKKGILLGLTQIKKTDDYLYHHSVDVLILALLTGMTLGYQGAELVELGVAALLHDLGKAWIDPQILLKPGPLSDTEFAEIKKHPDYGTKLVAGLSPKIREAIGGHHERYRGNGYPLGLQAEEIPPFAVIIGIADVYDAMTSDRVYRKAHPPNEVVEMLQAGGNFDFDIKYIRAFLENITPYPAGSLVRLSTGEIALVIRNHRAIPLYPRVRIIFGADGEQVEPREVELAEAKLTIVEVLSDADKVVYWGRAKKK